MPPSKSTVVLICPCLAAAAITSCGIYEGPNRTREYSLRRHYIVATAHAAAITSGGVYQRRYVLESLYKGTYFNRALSQRCGDYILQKLDTMRNFHSVPPLRRLHSAASGTTRNAHSYAAEMHFVRQERGPSMSSKTTCNSFNASVSTILLDSRDT